MDVPLVHPIQEAPVRLPTSVLCNCYAFVKQHFPTLPSTATILSNLAAEGRVVVFYYAEIGLYHYAIVRGERRDAWLIEETNYKHCTHDSRWVPKEDPAIVGFYTPQ
jgi:hypothetical protein